MSPYDSFDEDIKQLIRQGCSQNAALQRLVNHYPELAKDAAQVLKHIQKVEQDLRQQGR